MGLKTALILLNFLFVAFFAYYLYKRINRMENALKRHISISANNAVKGVKTPEPVNEELKGKGTAYNPSKDVDRMLSGKHIDFF